MNEEKQWYKSKTIWGGLVAFASAMAGLFGIDIDAASGDALALALANSAAAIGAAIAIIGRLDAVKTIS